MSNEILKVSQKGLLEIASDEGAISMPYLDSVRVWTWGIGHTKNAGGRDPAKHRGEALTLTEIMAMFKKDIVKYEKRVRKAFTVPLTQEEFDSAVSFDYNTGAITRATWVKEINAGDRVGAKKSYMNWRKPAEIIPRRQRNCDLFFKNVYHSDGFVNTYPVGSSGNILWSKGKRVKMDFSVAGAEVKKQGKKPSSKQTNIAIGAVGIAGVLGLFWDKVSTFFEGLF